MKGLTPEVARSTEHIFEKVSHVVTEPEWLIYAPLIHEINEWKQRKDAMILAHNYQPAEIFHGVADYTGDSLGLARKAGETDAETIVMCGVEFMAETAKLLNPDRTVLLPDDEADCSLADSITAEDVRELKALHPGVPVVTYVNTSAAVKAETDVCCTSSNAVEVVESLDSSRVIFLPDTHLAQYVAGQTDVTLITWDGHCVVHKEFRARDLQALRAQHPDLEIIAHPECTAEVQSEADMVGSTSQLIDHLETSRPEQVALITECTMADNVSAGLDDVEFIQPCSLCPYMKRISLEKTLRALKEERFVIDVPERIAASARDAVERMLAVS